MNPNNLPRAALFKHFCAKHDLHSIDLKHPTHHHFLGNGKFDEQLDVILCSGPQHPAETLSTILCKLSNPLIQSHHDIIVSELLLPLVDLAEPEPVLQAPKVPNDRVRIIWEDENIDHYQNLISSNLSAIRNRWKSSQSPSSISILLSSTNFAHSSAAKSSNKFVRLGKHDSVKPSVHPNVRAAQIAALQASEHFQLIASTSTDPKLLESARAEACSTKSYLRRLTRKIDIEACYQRENKLFTILQDNPSGLFKSIKSMKKNSSTKIQKLKVNDKVYSGSDVPDGFYQSLSTLKAPDMSAIHSSSSYQSTLGSYEHILKICVDGLEIPEISPIQATELLISLRPDVSDLYSITARHYLFDSNLYFNNKNK